MWTQVNLTCNYNIIHCYVPVPVFEKVHAKSLHYLVWLGVEVLRHNNYKLPPEFHTYSFTTLQVSVNKLGSVSVESLNRLDMDAFLYLTGKRHSYSSRVQIK